MKKALCLILCAVMLAALLPGCGPATPADTSASTEPSTEGAKTPTLSVGFGRADITPTEPVPLAGYHTVLDRMSDGVKDRIYATCVAMTDANGETLIIFSLEMLYAYDVMLFGASKISRKTGIPLANIMIGTTHSHSCPAVTAVDSAPTLEAYNEMLQERMVEAADMALADRKPAKMQFATTYPENINSIRHYIMSDGSYAGDNFGSFGGGRTIVGHVREVDNSLQLVKFVREGGKDIIMMNWQGHPTGHGDYRYKVLSWACRVTDTVEQGLDAHCIYILGASGNVNNSSRIPEEKPHKTYEERAAALGKYVINVTDYEDAEIGNIQVLAKSVLCTPKEGGAQVNVDVDVYSMGDFSLAAAPYEMYCENGEAIKEGSPFKMTFVSTCSNTVGSYIPSISTYDYNMMPDEVYGINMTRYVPGTAEILQDAMVDMLKEIYNTK